MKVIQVNNFHRILGGSDVVATATAELLRRRGHEVLWLPRDSRDLGIGLLGKVRAFLCGIYSISACREMEKMLRDNPPDVVHVHELFPFISPWILDVCQRRDVAVVMSCHNYRLTCPTAHHFFRDAPCELCAGGREYWCLLKNCRGNVFESAAYALRSMTARKLGLFTKNVTLFLALSESIKHNLVGAGCRKERIYVLPNFVSIPNSAINASRGTYFAFVGRVSPEKGIDTLLAAAEHTKLPVRFAGDYSLMADTVETAPANTIFMGFVKRGDLDFFYRGARCLILPSTCFEVNPLVVCEAMSYGLPVIASRIGGIPELVEDGKTGLLFEPGNPKELSSKMKLLWESPDLCKQMGQAGREKVVREYKEDVYYKGLIAIYRKALQIHEHNCGWLNST